MKVLRFNLFPLCSSIFSQTTETISPYIVMTINETEQLWNITTKIEPTDKLDICCNVIYKAIESKLYTWNLQLKIVNFLDASKTITNEAEGDLADNIQCKFQVEKCNLLNEGFTFVNGKRMYFECILTLSEDTDANAEFKEPGPIKIPTILDQLFQSVLNEIMHDSCADITLVTSDNKRFKAHRCFLAGQSHFFKFAIEEREGVISMNDVSSVTLIEILRYIYTETTQMDKLKTVAAEALYAVEKYMLPESFKEMCHQALKEALTISNAIMNLLLANEYGLKQLKSMAIHIIATHFLKIREEEAWINLLKSNSALVNEVYESIYNKSNDNIVGFG